MRKYLVTAKEVRKQSTPKIYILVALYGLNIYIYVYTQTSMHAITIVKKRGHEFEEEQ